MSFKKNDRVKVTAKSSFHEGEAGTVSYEYADNHTVLVRLDNGAISGFFASELERLDPNSEALIGLAETLDKARLQANAIDDLTIQSQRGVYGQIALSLHYTLEQIIGAGKDDIFNATADRVYDSILDGNTVREALASVVKK